VDDRRRESSPLSFLRVDLGSLSSSSRSNGLVFVFRRSRPFSQSRNHPNRIESARSQQQIEGDISGLKKSIQQKRRE